MPGSKSMIQPESRPLGSSRPLPIPCWPNPSRLVVFLTRDIDRFTFPYLAFFLPLIIAPLFIFDDDVGRTLHSIGYDDLVLLKGQYSFLLDRSIHVKFADFQILEIVAWFSIAIWTVRLLLGVIFLKEYDRRFLRISQVHHGEAYGALAMGAGGFYMATHVKLTFNAPAFLPLLRSLPQVYFWFMSWICFLSLSFVAIATLFLLWKLFRQKWRGAVLWHEDLPLQKGHKS
jgi:hypothetical protein